MVPRSWSLFLGMGLVLQLVGTQAEDRARGIDVVESVRCRGQPLGSIAPGAASGQVLQGLQRRARREGGEHNSQCRNLLLWSEQEFIFQER